MVTHRSCQIVVSIACEYGNCENGGEKSAKQSRNETHGKQHEIGQKWG
jgi:hypothetical protein